MRLRAEVVDLIGLDLVDELVNDARIGEIAVVEVEPAGWIVRVLVDLVNPAGVERTGSPDNPVDLVSLLQEEFGEVRPVLSGDAGDECSLHTLTSLPVCAKLTGSEY